MVEYRIYMSELKIERKLNAVMIIVTASFLVPILQPWQWTSREDLMQCATLSLEADRENISKMGQKQIMC